MMLHLIVVQADSSNYTTSHLSFDDDDDDESLTSQVIIIPHDPVGQTLVLRLLSTWGDSNYIGLAGIELFDAGGHLINCQLGDHSTDSKHDYFQVMTSPFDESYDEHCAKERLVNGVCLTMDELQHWLSPFVRKPGLDSSRNEQGQNTIVIKFPEAKTLSAIRIWNYNAKRVYLDRGVRDLEIRLDDTVRSVLNNRK